jgi:hypothetical protein
MERHKVVGELMRPAYKLYEMALGDGFDDLIPLAGEQYRPALASVWDTAQRDLLAELKRVEALFGPLKEAAEREARKKFAELAKAHRHEFSALMARYSGKDVTPVVRSRLAEGYRAKYPGKLFDIAAEVVA